MIQDIFPHRLNNQYDKEAVANEKDRVFCFRGGELLIKVVGESAGESGQLDFPTVKEMIALASCKPEDLIYLFSVDEERFFLLEPGAKVPEIEVTGEQGEVSSDSVKQGGAVSMAYAEVRSIRKQNLGPRYRIFAALTGKHLMDWYRDTRFCGRCGSKMTHSETERAMTCKECGYTVYPRIMPAVIVGVTNGNKLLMTKYQRGYQNYALVAGFTEIGETLEETVAREVMEETGVKVKNIRYYKSQPWGIANDILMGYYCDLDGSEEIHRDDAELKVAEWVEREAIELQPDDYSLTNEMMWMFKNGRV